MVNKGNQPKMALFQVSEFLLFTQTNNNTTTDNDATNNSTNNNHTTNVNSNNDSNNSSTSTNNNDTNDNLVHERVSDGVYLSKHVFIYSI